MITFTGKGIRQGRRPQVMDPMRSRQQTIDHGEVFDVPIRLQINRFA